MRKDRAGIVFAVTLASASRLQKASGRHLLRHRAQSRQNNANHCPNRSQESESNHAPPPENHKTADILPLWLTEAYGKVKGVNQGKSNIPGIASCIKTVTNSKLCHRLQQSAILHQVMSGSVGKAPGAMRRIINLRIAVVLAFAAAIPITTFSAAAQTPGSVTYQYDSNGRLIGDDYGSGNSKSYSYDPAGNRVSQSTNGSSVPSCSDGTWTDQTAAGSRNWVSVTSSSDGMKLAAAVSGGDIFTSADGGASWTDQVAAGSRAWKQIVSSSDGMKLAAVVSGGDIFTSADGGASWTDQVAAGSQYWRAISSSSDGMKLVASGSKISLSVDGGATWTVRNGPGGGAASIASSSDGTRLRATSSFYLWGSVDGGMNWGPGAPTTSLPVPPPLNDVALSSDGMKYAVASSDGIYIFAGSWVTSAATSSIYWRSIASSADGSKLAAAPYNGAIVTSTDGGATWTNQTATGSMSWYDIASSADGTRLAAIVKDGDIWTFTSTCNVP